MDQQFGGQEDQPDGTADPVRELRRGYHDRIAEVRDHSRAIVRAAVDGTTSATLALGGDHPAPDVGAEAQQMHALAAAVDAEVVDLLALEAPVARDLRLILASRDVTQLALLCIGLTVQLAGRVERVAEALSGGLREPAVEMGQATVDLLRQAETAWAALDADLAEDVTGSAGRARTAQTSFISALIGLSGVPMDSALDLAMVARAYERLADHAVEISERVLFAVHATPAPLVPP